MRRWAMLLCALLLASAGGCASDEALLSNSPTGGIELEMLHEGAANRAEFYQVDADGTLSFGGGKDALARRTSWTGPMSDEHLARFREMIAEHDWLGEEPRSTDEPRTERAEVSIRSGGKSRSFTLRGRHPEVESLAELLREASESRLERFLRTLPEPNAPKDVSVEDAETPQDAPPPPDDP